MQLLENCNNDKYDKWWRQGSVHWLPHQHEINDREGLRSKQQVLSIFLQLNILDLAHSQVLWSVIAYFLPNLRVFVSLCLPYHSRGNMLITTQRSSSTHPPIMTIIQFSLRQGWRIKRLSLAPIFLPQGLRPCCRHRLQWSCSIFSKWLTWSGFATDRRDELLQTRIMFFLRAAYPVTSHLQMLMAINLLHNTDI